jgi:hypothetical protein
MANLDVIQKARVYHTLSRLNSAFAAVVGTFDPLVQAGVLTPKFKRLFEGFALELQAEINSEILSPLHDAEWSDWARHGKVRQRWEKYLRGPNPKRRKV